MTSMLSTRPDLTRAARWAGGPFGGEMRWLGALLAAVTLCGGGSALSLSPLSDSELTAGQYRTPAIPSSLQRWSIHCTELNILQNSDGVENARGGWTVSEIVKWLTWNFRRFWLRTCQL